MDQDVTYRLIRRPSVGAFTIGEVFAVDADTLTIGARKWFTGEDAIREIPGVPVDQWKVPGETAIPSGRYRIVVTFSNRLQRLTPRLLDVPGFDGILIHQGSFAQDTHGCILPGMATNDTTAVWQSVRAYDQWFHEIQSALFVGDRVWIDVRNPPV